MKILLQVSRYFKHVLKPPLQTFKLQHWKQSICKFASHPSIPLTQGFPENSKNERNTIFALSTATGMSAIAIVRISGPSAKNVFFDIGKQKKLPKERMATLCYLKDPVTDDLLDQALSLFFPAPNSFTGEDLCELHIHGGVAVVTSVLGALQKLPNFRFAEPGEFTKRAFMAGKLETGFVFIGNLFKHQFVWTCLARVEAYIDFSEDQHLDESILNTVEKDVEVLQSEISAHLSDKRRGEKLRNGVFTALVGRPNVGKSSLLNSLCRRDIAIVSPTAGTTRDIIESSLNLGGYLVNVCDTAGIRDSPNAIEQEGVKRAKQRSSESDLLIFIVEAKQALHLLQSLHNSSILEFLLEKELGKDFLKNRTLNSKDQDSNIETPDCILLLNKIDLLSASDLEKIEQLKRSLDSVCAVSCVDGTGMNEFLEVFAEKVKNICSCPRGDSPTLTQERHRHHLKACLENLQAYAGCLRLDAAMGADRLRMAADELGRITGKIRTEDVLDIVFRDFCIGK
ncbi:hypothetical protein JTE90_008539 [Oedothorax gibbosus]|uniref:TrmE-type G domain-containing protein n=1 Tax=Oedothorax gibbosus TaxID=931172 RepID=A0AAV6VH34_9ARAC|nr:hypothetical protein JTE90_008539 [Oedothorax gibbosus]